VQRLYRLASAHPEPRWPLWSVGEDGGGWVEFQRGPHQGRHWLADSLYVDADVAWVVEAPLASVLGGFDPYAFYEDRTLDDVRRMAEALEAHGCRIHDPAGVTEAIAGPVAGLEPQDARFVVSDLCVGLAEWLMASTDDHHRVSILGA